MDTKPTRITRYIWPEDANRLVKKARGTHVGGTHAALLHSELQELTHHSSYACWRFLERHGIQRPGSGKRKFWDSPKIVDFIMDNGYDAAAQKFGRSKQALYSLMQRENRAAGHGSDHFSMNQLRKELNIRVDTIHRWIRDGRLKATAKPYGNKTVYIVTNEQLLKFLTEEARSLVSSRFPQKRVDFLINYLYNGKHMDFGLLRTRESKKEGDAYRRQMSASSGQSPTARD